MLQDKRTCGQINLRMQPALQHLHLDVHNTLNSVQTLRSPAVKNDLYSDKTQIDGLLGLEEEVERDIRKHSDWIQISTGMVGYRNVDTCQIH